MTKWTASEMGRKGDGSKSPAKQAAVRENGRRGGPMKVYDLYIDNQPQGLDVLAATPASAARKLGLRDWFQHDGKIWWDDDGKHFEVIPKEGW